jgi:hypothetical protein
MSRKRFSPAQMIGKDVSTETKTITAVWERGARPSGVDDPNIIEFGSMLNE